MATYNQQAAYDMIAAFGGVCILRRDGADRDCMAGTLEFSPREQQINMTEVGARRFLIAAVFSGVVIEPPDEELDKLIAFGEVLRILKPPKRLRPDGNTIYYDVEVVYDSAA